MHLTALYRSHDYRYKVPGNLLGLARLQCCVAYEVGRSIGNLTVHSSYAYLNGSKGAMCSLLKIFAGMRKERAISMFWRAETLEKSCLD